MVNKMIFLLPLLLAMLFYILLFSPFSKKSNLLDFYDEVDRYFILNYCLEGIEQIEVLENEG